jgi:hypothetical protein
MEQPLPSVIGKAPDKEEVRKKPHNRIEREQVNTSKTKWHNKSESGQKSKSLSGVFRENYNETNRIQ